ncbi:MAG: type III PLP-dependent enzyme [Alphaproteobacteria bacterium]|nr:MAG: type III PLP-dependent enzyme [Alphaproteobacteria bacterium]
MSDYHSAYELVSAVKPAGPVFCQRPHAIRAAARWFKMNFPGRCLYAVKANPSPWVISILAEEGLSFDVASLDEARRVRALAPDAMLGFMHPIKAYEAIREAYFDLGIRTFSLDSLSELQKIMAATDNAKDLTLCVRLRVSSELSKISLGAKFGAGHEEASLLLAAVRQKADRLGVCFHVGSQAMHPGAFAAAIDLVERAIIEAGVIVDVLDVGGGFPAPYPGYMAPPLEDYVAMITARFEELLVTNNCELWCEPGRALTAESMSLVVRVEARKGHELYINDGVYGALFDAGQLGWTYPVRLLRPRINPSETGFSFYGPTCDDYDHMKGPFYLPSDAGVGDYIEIGNIGAYGAAMATRFNGFGAFEEFLVEDAPMLTAYGRMAQLPVPFTQTEENNA